MVARLARAHVRALTRKYDVRYSEEDVERWPHAAEASVSAGVRIPLV